ncbi:RsiV family protein [Mycolicibacterium sp.]|uniref:RsiV family protein n=1 Tax=Mycolicibacterium sp. TaxID=2320850 RepID=UPI003D0CE4B5
MKRTIRTAVIATLLGAAALGFAGAATAAPLDDPKGLCANHDAAGNCLFAYSGPSHNVDVTFPAGDPQEQAIIDYVNTTIDDFESGAGPLGTLDTPLPLEELDVTGTRYTSGHTQSVVVETYQMMRGAAHPATWYKSFTWDNAAHTPVGFDGLFRPGTEPLAVILPIVAQQMSAEAGQPLTIDPAVGLDPANYRNFAITDDAVTFFFDRDQMHPAYGATQVSVPRNAIADLLTPGL